ncbi:tRNA dihydrouridine synthase DusB [Methylolobus aquaticus]|nr:tRNA dihydrouridine synthase DusB [Methylolobus aquaticus]
MQIGPYRLANRLILAPMAGITDLPYRNLCRRWGAGMAVAEMATSNPALLDSRKTRQKTDHRGETEPRVAQILGAEPMQMAEAARFNVERGAQIIDINMGCPAKKVCNKAAGSALLRDERLVAQILDAVVQAVDVPVTLKIRTGWDAAERNAVSVAKLAAAAGVSALSVHGRTRACGFSGSAEYHTIAMVKASVNIPVIANGDIDSAEKAQQVLEATRADGIMIGRAALGRPWIFRQIERFLESGIDCPPPGPDAILATVREHLQGLYAHYGEYAGVRIARKHVGWYLGQAAATSSELLRRFNQQETAPQQWALLPELFNSQRQGESE